MKTTSVDPKIENWYMKGQYVPSLGTQQFGKFAAHGYSLINQINPRTEIFYKVDATSPTAYWDAENKTIALPGWYFIPDGVAKFSTSDHQNYDAITLINGSTIHEALHAKHTSTPPTEAMVYINRQIGHLVDEQLSAIVINVVEDVFIESIHSLKAFQVAWLTAKNDLLFNDEIFAEALANYDKTNPLCVAMFLSNYKRVALRSRLVGIVDGRILSLLAELGKFGVTPVRRMQIALEIIKIIEVETEKAAAEKAEADKFEGSDGDGEGTEGDGESDGSEEEDSKSEPKSETKPETKEDEESSEPFDAKKASSEGAQGDEAKEVKKAVKENSTKLSKSISAFEKEYKKAFSAAAIEESIAKTITSVAELEKQLSIRDVDEISHYEKNLQNINLTNRFATLLKQMRTVLPARGRGKEYGGKIDSLRLHQVAIDGKVFATKTIEVTGNNDKVEIALLVDASGSMGGHSSSGGWSLFEHCISVTSKIFRALLTSGVETKVFAHTSYSEYNYPLLVKIANNRTTNFERKFKKAMEISLRENLDGIIINEIVNHQFTSDSRTAKVLLVLSDGSPQSPNYSHGVGSVHTKKMIENARAKGVKVYSLSLVSSVVRANDDLYGSEFNVDATKDLDKEMTNLVMKLVRRK